MKIGRNEKCPCGSSKKHKHCCGNSLKQGGSILDQIHKASVDGLEYDTAAQARSLAILNDIARRADLSVKERHSVQIALANAYRNIGEHNKALSALDTIVLNEVESGPLKEQILYYRAISLDALGNHNDARQAFDELLLRWRNTTEPQGESRRARGFFLIEAGKVYSSSDEPLIAKTCWETAVRYLESFGEIEHVNRARSNLAYLDLCDENPDVEARGLAELERLTQAKLRIGDLPGAATNYCNLGTYYWREQRYQRAIAYFRKDLALSKLAGNKRDLASTWGNLAMLYADMWQLKEARSCLREVGLIAQDLHDESLKEITKKQIEIVNQRGRSAGLEKITVGADASCACGSGGTYSGCCGKADFEPVDLPFIFGGISEDIAVVKNELRENGQNELSRLDFILRNTPESKRRKAWSKIETHDGWLSMHELPDMANTHLLAAKTLASQEGASEDTSNALGAVILSVCYLEAFINQLSFFVYEENNIEGVTKHVLPPQLASDGPQAYQKTTSLETKWYQISEVLLGKNWLDSEKVWKETRDLIYIRNELVHFKTGGYEQVVPPPTTPGIIYTKIPVHVEVKDVPHAWPTRLINASLARWAVDVAERMVDGLKLSYRHSRQSKN